MTTEASKKIAAITDDGKTISQHFGRAQYYLVATLENSAITHREMRAKLGHGNFAGEQNTGEHEHGHEQHGMDADFAQQAPADGRGD